MHDSLLSVQVHHYKVESRGVKLIYTQYFQNIGLTGKKIN